MNDTIFALSTIFGKSGIAVFRITGANATKIFKIFKSGSQPTDRVFALRKIYNSEHALLDKCLIVCFSAPHSFTGEDMVELHIHGSIAIIKGVSTELHKHFRLANPGEFSLRSFLNNKMSLDEAESLATLMEAETFKQLEFATKLKDTGEIYKEVHKNLISLIVSIEASIDFSEYIDEAILFQEIRSTLTTLISKLKNLMNTSGVIEKIRSGIQIALIGSPNVGKSTLLNYIAKREAAIVSKIPGTTRDIIEINMNLYDYPVTFLDTAGIRESSDEIELKGISRSIKKSKEAHIKIILFESNANTDVNIINLVDSNTICFLTKSDNTNTNEPIQITNNIFAYPISVHQNLGMSSFFDLIKSKVEELLCISSPFLLAERHTKYISEALNILQLIDLNLSIELIAEDIRYVSNIFEKITSKVQTENILDEIFGRFCIGK